MTNEHDHLEDADDTGRPERGVSAISKKPPVSKAMGYVMLAGIIGLMGLAIYYSNAHKKFTPVAAATAPKPVVTYQGSESSQAPGTPAAVASTAPPTDANTQATGGTEHKPSLVVFSATSGAGGSFSTIGNNPGPGSAPAQGVRGSQYQPASVSAATTLAPGASGNPGLDAILAAQRGGQSVQQSDTLQQRLAATPLTGVSASLLPHQPYLLTMGTLVPCILQTAMDSTLPGLVTCVLPQDVLSKTGLTLLDRGTKIVGQYESNSSNTLERLFVLWTRAETPSGVVINLASPAADPLGRSGMDGEVDTHFWQRFGGALMLSMVDGTITALDNLSAKQGTTTINTGSESSVASASLNSTMNIPTTIRKNQGELVSIFIARDLDFSTVYAVRPAAGSGMVGAIAATR